LKAFGWFNSPIKAGDLAMMGPKQEVQAALFYEFSLEDHVPQDHLLRSIDRFVDLSDIRQYLADFYSHTGRPSIDPELLNPSELSLRMLARSPRSSRASGS
jgi:hypothetical protein